MRFLMLKEDAAALLPLGLANLVKRELLQRPSQGAEARAESVATVDRALALKRELAAVNTVTREPLLVVAYEAGDKPLDLPGLDLVEASIAEIFGADAIPETIAGAITAHRAQVAHNLIALAFIGPLVENLVTTAQAVAACSDTTPHGMRPEVMALQGALDKLATAREDFDNADRATIEEAIDRVSSQIPRMVEIYRKGFAL